MIIMDPRADYGSHEVNIINLSEERKKRSEALEKLAQQDAFLLGDPGDETETTLKTYNDGTRDKV